jgi:hypothetical protein
MNLAVESYLRGEERGRRLLEELLISEDFFSVISTTLSDTLQASDVNKCQVCLLLIIRRLNSCGSIYVDCGDILSLLVSASNMAFAQHGSIIDTLARCLAKVAVLSSTPVSTIHHVYSNGFDHLYHNIKFLSEVALAVSLCSHDLKSQFQGV